MSPYRSLKIKKQLDRLGVSEREIWRWLGPQAAMMARVIGIGKTLDLIDRYGGRKLYIPAVAEECHGISQVIGLEAAQKLTEIFIPAQHTVIANPFSQMRLLKIEGMKLLASGETYGEVAAKLGVARSTVRDWRAQLPEKREVAR